MKILIALAILSVFVTESFAQNNALRTNVFDKTTRIYEGHVLNGRLRDLGRYFRCVRGGGVNLEMDGIHLERFMDLVSVVSNNCEAIASDWHTYETNEMVRFTTLSAVGFSGYNKYTNFVRRLLDSYDEVPRTNSWKSIQFISGPYGIPMDFQLALNYESSIVSNLISRIKKHAAVNNATNDFNWCNKVLSGEWKRNYLIMEAAGAL